MKQLLFIGTVERYCWREVLRGLADDPRLLQEWIVRPQPVPASLAGWRTLVRDLHPEAVMTCEPLAIAILPLINEYSLVLAAEHFLERHFREFACIGYAQPTHYAQRLAGFEERLRVAQCSLHKLMLTEGTLRPQMDQSPQAVLQFLRTLPRPCALFAGDDDLAAVVLELCQLTGICVPQHLAVLGAGDDSLTCHLATPPLSSIRLPYRELGRRAASLLLAWQPTLPQECYLLKLPPVDVTLRQSSDVTRNHDPLVARAIRHLTENLNQPITISTLRDHLGVSTPELLERFRDQLHTTPAAELRRLRIEHAKHLLVTTRAPMKDVARRSGFANIFHFMSTFKQLTGMSVCSYRRAATAAAP